MCVFFFFKQKTAYELRISDWSSDVCSSDLLKAFAPDRKNTIVFSGFQAAGTRGRAMLEGAREIKIHGQWISVAAEVTDLPMLSAHADANELMRWLSGFQRPPRSEDRRVGKEWVSTVRCWWERDH